MKTETFYFPIDARIEQRKLRKAGYKTRFHYDGTPSRGYGAYIEYNERN